MLSTVHCINLAFYQPCKLSTLQSINLATYETYNLSTLQLCKVDFSKLIHYITHAFFNGIVPSFECLNNNEGRVEAFVLNCIL